MKLRKVLSHSATARAVQKVIHYEFRNPLLLLEAFQGPGLHKEKGFVPIKNGHQRLASVGDAVLLLLVKERLFHLQLPLEARHPLVKRLVSNSNLSAVFKRLDFEKYLRVRQGQDPGHEKTTADAMEGIIGAVYLDSGMQPALQVCSRMGLIPTLRNLRREYSEDGTKGDDMAEDQDVEVLTETSEGVSEEVAAETKASA